MIRSLIPAPLMVLVFIQERTIVRSSKFLIRSDCTRATSIICITQNRQSSLVRSRFYGEVEFLGIEQIG